MPENEIIPINDAALETAAKDTSWEQFERGQLSRRQALKKLGITSTMAVAAMFSVDDLARLVGKAMEQRARDNKVVEQVAREFQQAGIAMAGGPSGCTGNGGSGCGTPSSCQHCSNQLWLDDCYCSYKYDTGGSNPDPTMAQHCYNQATINYNGCLACWCPACLPVDNTNGPNCPPVSSQQPPQGCNC